MTKAVARLLEPLRAVEPTPALLSMDTDVSAIRFQGKAMRADMREALVDAALELTLDAAPSLQLDFRDPNSDLLRSGFFGEGNLDGDGVQVTVRNVRWRLMGVRRGADGALSCTFEDETVAGLRGIRRVRVAPRGKLTRAQFIQARIRELRPLVKFVCPELNDRQPVDAAKAGKSGGATGVYGLPKSGVKVKEGKADANQRRNLETILDVGVAAGASRKEMEAAIAACIVESVARTSATNGQHVGLFQMNDDKGTVAQRRNATFAAKWFFSTAKARLKAKPSLSVVQLAEAVEVSGNASAYQRWLAQAKGIVTAYMGGGGETKGNRRAAATGKYMFSIGPPGGEKRESYWDGFQRLATEVEWRFFVVAGVAYYMSEPRMYAAKPILTVDPDSEVVRALEFEVDAGMRTSEATLTVDAELWSIPPGATVELTDCGPATGRWLVVGYRRSLFDTAASIALRKPKPELPEPAAEQRETGGAGAVGRRPVGGSTSLDSVRPTGEWAGTQAIFTQYVTPFMRRHGLNAGSQKRTYDTVSGAGVSDHYTGATSSYAIDYPTNSGEAAAAALAKDMGIAGWKANSTTSYAVMIGSDRFTVQILWGGGIDHGDHVHVGIRRR
ncbi:MAG TPA: hypothetical protein VNM48_21000 [Chloroflexota bacterium]|nr:hypothetical protein [Chloroflexota bacterium]